MNPATRLAIQSWILWGTGSSVIFLRIIFRRITLGSIKKLQADDWLMVFIIIPFTASIVLVNQVSNGQSPRQHKFRYLLEELQILTVWLVETCLLVLYWRIIPIETSLLKRHGLKWLSTFFVITFLVVQTSLIAWCRPTEAHWNLTRANSQCVTYHNHTITTLVATTINTICIMMAPISFIPTPRCMLLAGLFILSTLVLLSGIASRVNILRHTASRSYLRWYTTESTLSIVFANLPFLTSMMLAAAPARLRDNLPTLRANSQLALNQWPRSRRGSCVGTDASRHGSWTAHTEELPPLSPNKLGSAATTICEPLSPIDTEKTPEWASSMGRRDTLQATHSRDTSSILEIKRVSGGAIPETDIEAPPATPTLPAPERVSAVPKTRLSGGLAEMGDISTTNTEGWPIYWK